jgi:mono/diheme cytochrome c family protein
MGKLRGTMTVVAVALASATGGGAAGCSNSFFNGETDHAPQATPPDSESFPGKPFSDGGAPAPPVLLSTLITAEHTPPPISGGSLAVQPDGKLVVIADPDRDAVYLVEPETLFVRTVALATGSEPGRVVLDGNGAAHVALRSSGAVVRIDLKSAAITAQTKTCSLPRGVAYDEAKAAVWVACADGQLIALSSNDHAELSRHFVALDLRDVIVSKSGECWVSRYRSAELLRVKEDGTIARQSGPHQATSTRFDIETEVNSKGEGASSGGPRQVTMSPTLAWKMVGGADGAPVMLHQQSQDDEVVISASGGYGGGCATITQAGITQYDDQGNAGASMGLGGAALAVDIAVSHNGRWMAVAKPGAYLRGEQPSIEVLSASLSTSLATDPGVDDEAPAPVSGPSVDGGLMPPPILSPGESCASGWGEGFDMQATAVDFDDQNRLYVFSREPAQLRVYESQSGEFESFPSFFESQAVNLSTRSVRDTGHELFHTDVGTGLACASCHGEALDDGHVWNFKDVGPRRTQNMRGGLSKTLPLHWEGDLATFDNLVDEVMTRRMGGFVVEHKYADALAKWLDKQPSLTLSATDPAASARGKKLFESAEVACTTCHTGDTLTNNQTVDVGTGGKFQVPSLHGVALHAPFMHDGCAQTLTDRFDGPCGGGDKHGKTSQLSEAQIADLVAYLETL